MSLDKLFSFIRKEMTRAPGWRSGYMLSPEEYEELLALQEEHARLLAEQKPKKPSNIVAFTLTMPQAGSWNGKWSGEGQVFAIVKNLGTGTNAQKKALSLDGQWFVHNWDDGWSARIDCRIVTPAEARKIRKDSQGFCGYGWMVDNILLFGSITRDDPDVE